MFKNYFFSQLIKQIETKRLSKTFAQLLYLASISQLDLDRQICSISNCENQQRNVLLLTNVPDLSTNSMDVSFYSEFLFYSFCGN